MEEALKMSTAMSDKNTKLLQKDSEIDSGETDIGEKMGILKNRRASFPKRQLSRTDSTTMEVTGQSIAPILHHNPHRAADVADVAQQNDAYIEDNPEGTTTCIYSRRDSKRRLSRTDSTIMVVTRDPNSVDFTTFKHEELACINSVGSEGESKSLLNSCSNNKGENIQAATKDKLEHKISDKHNLSISNSSSCPNLVRHNPGISSKVVQQKLRSIKSSEGSLCVRSMSPNDHNSVSKLLQVPNIFTVSHSYSDGNIQQKSNQFSSSTNSFNKSAPQLILPSGVLNYDHSAERLTLIKSLSDNPASKRRAKFKQLSDARVKMIQSVDAIDEKSHAPFSPLLGQIVSGLFMGNVESAYCERLLCKNKITSIVDLTGCPPEAIPVHKRSLVPCTCGMDKQHLRATLRICLEESSVQELEENLQKVAKFIEGAIQNQKGILVHCYYGNRWSAIAIIYYLMKFKGMNLRKAYSMVMMHRSDLELNVELKGFLQKVERKLVTPEDQCLSFDVVLSQKTTLLPKEAWVNYDV